jgi:hypothetical protein
MGIDIHFDRGVHSNNSQSPDNLGTVGDLLTTQQEFRGIFVPVGVEALETVGREADGGCGGEVEVARVEEVEEGILEDFGPDFEVFKVCASGLYVVS